MSEPTMDGIPPSICEVLLNVLVEFGLHAPPPRGIKPPPLVVALYEAAAAYYAPVQTLESRCLFESRQFLESIASAQPLGTMDQSEWMIAQAKEGVQRSLPFREQGAAVTESAEHSLTDQRIDYDAPKET